MLHLVQAEEGYVTPQGIAFCAETLGLTKAEVGAVATFYTMYKRRPTGEYLVSVCTNLSCQILGGEDVFARLAERARRPPQRDHRRRHLHAGARRVPGGLRLRARRHRQLRVLRQRHPRQRRGAGRRAGSAASARCPPAAPRCARSRRSAASSPASAIRVPRRSAPESPTRSPATSPDSRGTETTAAIRKAEADPGRRRPALGGRDTPSPILRPPRTRASWPPPSHPRRVQKPFAPHQPSHR